MKIDDKFLQNEAIFSNKFQGLSDSKTTDKNTDSIPFGDVLKNAVNDVNNNMIASDSATKSFVKGDDVSIDDVMVKNQEASLGLQFLTLTRDKLLEGYNELSKMQL